MGLSGLTGDEDRDYYYFLFHLKFISSTLKICTNGIYVVGWVCTFIKCRLFLKQKKNQKIKINKVTRQKYKEKEQNVTRMN